MRNTKLFKIGLENQDEAYRLKDLLKDHYIQDNGITYGGFIDFFIEKEFDKVNVNIYTYLELNEFRNIVDKCSDYATFFQYIKG